MDNVEEELDIDDLYEKGEIVYRALVKRILLALTLLKSWTLLLRAKNILIS